MKKPIFVIIIVLLLDQALKFWVKLNMTLGEDIHLIGNWCTLHFTENNGMAFGIELFGEWGKLGLSIFRILFVIVLIWYLTVLAKRNTKTSVLICVALVIAGALGNIIDSLFYGLIFSESTFYEQAVLFPEAGGYSKFLHGKVVDMLYFPVIEIPIEEAPSWMPRFLFGADGYFVFFRPIFNLADTAISVAVIWFLLFERKFLKGL